MRASRFRSLTHRYIFIGFFPLTWTAFLLRVMWTLSQIFSIFDPVSALGRRSLQIKTKPTTQHGQ